MSPSASTESTLFGEPFVGEGVNAIHINAVLGRKGGPVETAWATALATPHVERPPFPVVIRPDVPVLPSTLSANEAFPDRYGKVTRGPVQAEVAARTAIAVDKVLIPADEARNPLCIVAAWVNPTVDDEDAVYENNRAPARGAIYAAVQEKPSVEDVLQYPDSPTNPFHEAGR